MAIIRPAIFPQDAALVLEIWREFVASPTVSLDFQNNEADFAQLPGKYATPDGCVLLADRDGKIEGCVALRKVSTGVSEMKRLYVRPRARGNRLGHLLVDRLITEARIASYSEIRLDVLEEFVQARKLYSAFGFVVADPVTFNPLPGTTFLGLRL